ncbi:DNA repair protein RecO [Streptococcus moroccensis]|uniref:DNA repair protein RecO n=1 Tax=Streptococcus moroccensis TaxID=1451356 RepID=A0ABT9YQ28_9STRE|nr:DNA repair protein RecO [Streptococcus moroccensis]MDQ0222104.1 DNA repair protein RecO (recombination protein O) [Streptococcus moroccensis]
MNRVETKGIVLYNRPYRESDMLVKLFTETEGKRMFFVKHARDSKLTPVIQPLTTSDFILKLGQEGLGFIEDYRDSKTFVAINEDIFKLAFATYVVALADAAIQDNIADPSLFAFLTKTLELMEEGLDEEVLTNIFEIQVLSRFGVSLNFSECVVCHRVGMPLDFSYQYAGCLCPDHVHQDAHRAQVDPNVIYLLSRFQGVSFEELRTISVGPEMKVKLRAFIDQLYEEYVGIHLKAKKFIDDMADWGQLMHRD